MDSKLEISFGGFSAGWCILLVIFLIRDVEDAFNPTYLMGCWESNPIQLLSCVNIWLVCVRYNPLGGSVAYKQILYTGIRNLSRGELRISFLFIPRIVVHSRYYFSHFLFVYFSFVFLLFVCCCFLSPFFDDQNDLYSQGTLTCKFDFSKGLGLEF